MKRTTRIRLCGAAFAVMPPRCPAWPRRSAAYRARPRHHHDQRETASAARSEVRRGDQEKASESKASSPPRVVPPKGAQRAAHYDGRRGFAARHVRRRRSAPAMDRVAKKGYVTRISTLRRSARPARAAIITGRNHHVAGFGVVGESPRDFRATTRSSRKGTAPSGQFLKENGYATWWFGKDHNTPFYQATGGPLRAVAERHGIRALLRLCRRRRQPVAAELVPQYDGHLPVRGRTGRDRPRPWPTRRSNT